MCKTQPAIYRPCGRIHITAKCSNKNCSIRRQQKEVDKRRPRGLPRCLACYGVSLPMQIWHMICDVFSWPLRQVRLLWVLWRTIRRWFMMVLWYLIMLLRWMANWVLGVPHGSRGKWWPRGNAKRLEIVVRGVVFVTILFVAFRHFALVEKCTPWYSRAFWTPVTWTCDRVIGSRRNVVMRVLYWILDHTPAVVKALMQSLIGIFNYIRLTWCETSCALSAGSGRSKALMVKGCKWECFNNL